MFSELLCQVIQSFAGPPQPWNIERTFNLRLLDHASDVLLKGVIHHRSTNCFVLSENVAIQCKPIRIKIALCAAILLAVSPPLGHGQGLGGKIWEVDFHKPAFPGGNETPGTICQTPTIAPDGSIFVSSGNGGSKSV